MPSPGRWHWVMVHCPGGLAFEVPLASPWDDSIDLSGSSQCLRVVRLTRTFTPLYSQQLYVSRAEINVSVLTAVELCYYRSLTSICKRIW